MQHLVLHKTSIRTYIRPYILIAMTHTRKLMRMSSHSYALIIPKEIVEKYGWRERQLMAITDRGRGTVEVRDSRQR